MRQNNVVFAFDIAGTVDMFRLKSIRRPSQFSMSVSSDRALMSSKDVEANEASI